MTEELRALINDYIKKPSQGVLYLETYGVQLEGVQAEIVKQGLQAHLVEHPEFGKPAKWRYINGSGLSKKTLREQIKSAVSDLS
jgi:hypothetical protein